MKSFRKNAVRLAKQNKGSFIGAVLIIAIGIFVFVAMMDTLGNLRNQIDYYYQKSALGDVFAEVSGISEADLEKLTDIPGIDRVSGKMAADLRLLADGQEEIVTVHLLSYDEGDPLNKLSLSGRFTNDDRIFLGGKMADTYGYPIGTELRILSGGKSTAFTFAGSCYAPNYIYSIPPGGAMMPDGEVYDIACIEKERMQELLGKGDSVNELSFALSPGYSFSDVEGRLSDELSAYGLLSLTEREHQTSYNMVEGETQELITVGSVLPALFMAISVFMLYIVLKKMIDRDQALIGTMKAFGMTDRELVGAYLLEGGAVGAVGAVIGSVLASPFGRFMFSMYVDFFNLPDTNYHDYLWSRAAGLAIGVLTGVLAAWVGVKAILSIVPAQAMAARAPASARTLRLPAGTHLHLTALQKTGLSAILRNPLRGFVIMLSTAFPFSMIAVLSCFPDVAEQMFLSQFADIQTYDLRVSTDGYDTPERLFDAASVLDDAAEYEAVCTLPAELSLDNRSEFTVIYGLNHDSDLWRIMDNRGQYYDPPEKGLILNSRTADKLHAAAGDVLWVSCPGVTADEVQLPVVDVIGEAFGGGSYISMDSLPDALGISPMANTLLIRADHGRRQPVKDQLSETSRVSWASDAVKTLASYRSMMQSMIAMINLFSLMSFAAGGILIYNVSMINIRERTSELGTLMILGAGFDELKEVLRLEQLLYFLAGILLGIPGSMGVRWLVQTLFVTSDSYTIDLQVPFSSYVLAFGACLLMTFLALSAEGRFVKTIALPDILKDRGD